MINDDYHYHDAIPVDIPDHNAEGILLFNTMM